MRFFPFVSLLLLAFTYSCTQKAYKDKEEIQLSQSWTASAMKPQLERTLYRAVIDGKIGIKKFHMSGLLYLKNLDDTATRVVFQSEMGNTFFDFGWNHQDSFSVYHITDLMNKAALIKTLKKDFELLLAKNLSEKPAGIYYFNHNRDETYVKFEMEKGFVYYVINRDRELERIEHADDKRKVVVMQMRPETPPSQLAERIQINHLRAGFTIDLKKINQDAEE